MLMLSPPVMHRILVRTAPILSCVLPIIALAGCASPGGSYPSLAIRDVERAQGQFESPPPQPVEVPQIPTDTSGAMGERLNALDSLATSSHQDFTRKVTAATRAARVGANAAIASDAWAAAQVAVSDLDSARSNTAITLGDLDSLMVARAVVGEDLTAIELVRQKVIGMVEEEDRTLAQLRAKIR